MSCQPLFSPLILKKSCTGSLHAMSCDRQHDGMADFQCSTYYCGARLGCPQLHTGNIVSSPRTVHLYQGQLVHKVITEFYLKTHTYSDTYRVHTAISFTTLGWSILDISFASLRKSSICWLWWPCRAMKSLTRGGQCVTIFTIIMQPNNIVWDRWHKVSQQPPTQRC